MNTDLSNEMEWQTDDAVESTIRLPNAHATTIAATVTIVTVIPRADLRISPTYSDKKRALTFTMCRS